MALNGFVLAEMTSAQELGMIREGKNRVRSTGRIPKKNTSYVTIWSLLDILEDDGDNKGEDDNQ